MVSVQPEKLFIHGAVPADVVSECQARFSRAGTIGAHVVFLGQVRADPIDDGVVSGIEYTAHESMARDVISRIVRDADPDEELLDLEVRHSLGYVPAGGISLLVAVATGHRDAAYRISRDILEAIKKDLPVYGREIAADDRSRWKVNR